MKNTAKSFWKKRELKKLSNCYSNFSVALLFLSLNSPESDTSKWYFCLFGAVVYVATFFYWPHGDGGYIDSLGWQIGQIAEQ